MTLRKYCNINVALFILLMYILNIFVCLLAYISASTGGLQRDCARDRPYRDWLALYSCWRGHAWTAGDEAGRAGGAFDPEEVRSQVAAYVPEIQSEQGFVLISLRQILYRKLRFSRQFFQTVSPCSKMRINNLSFATSNTRFLQIFFKASLPSFDKANPYTILLRCAPMRVSEALASFSSR